MYPNALIQGQNFRQLMLQRVFHEVANDKRTWGDYVKSLAGPGYAVNDLVKSMYKSANEHLWKGGDHLLLTRMYELEEKGYSIDEARVKAEKDIFNYRVPTHVGAVLLGTTGSHNVGEIFRRPIVQMFGRYHYGIARSLATIAKDIVAPLTGQDRIDALGKVTAMGLLALGVHPALNWGLRQIPGNADNHISVPWPGQIGWLHAAGKFAADHNWMSATGRLFSLAPFWDLLDRVRTNRDVFGRHIIEDRSSLTGKAAQAIEGAARAIPGPGQYFLEAMKPGGIENVLGKYFGADVHAPPDPRQPKWDARDAAAARRRENNDGFTQFLKRLTGQ